MKQRRLSFKLLYVIYIVILAGLVTAAVLYVRTLLKQYEASQPELLARTAASQLADDAAAGDFWNKYGLSDVSVGPFEQNRDVQNEYLSLYTGELTVSQSAGSEDTLVYSVKRDGMLLADISLKAAGPAVTKLAVFSLRDWTVESVTPVFAPRDYTLTLPDCFDVQVNGNPLTAEHGTDAGNGLRTYTLKALYLEPSFKITDEEGNYGSYSIDKSGQVLVEFYDYHLTLPETLTVSCNGPVLKGKNVGSGLIRYDITLLAKPSVAISDILGNAVYYEGGDQQIPLTRTRITVGSNYTVQVNGVTVPAETTAEQINPEFTYFADYVKELPTIRTYDIAALWDNAQITVTDPMGNPVVLEEGTAEYDLITHAPALDTVPVEVSSQVDVLQIAQMWSMFLTKDLPFEELEPHLIRGSYQHSVAVNYATGVDIQYTSKHTLFDPAFTENSVTNFTWITPDCFCVDISFVKHMRLYYGARVDDPMNDRFYFVRYDDTDNGVNDPVWKLAGMKEIV